MADRPGVRRVRADRGADPPPADVWPMTVPAVAQLWAEGLELAAGTTVLVGENASGKSTVVEVLAAALGLNPQGGSSGSRMEVRRTEPEALPLVVERSPGAPRWSYLLRDETLHGLYSYLEDNPRHGGGETSFHTRSHGEAFLSIFEDRLRGPGSTCWTSRTPRSPSAASCAWSPACCSWPGRARSSSSPPTHPWSPPSPGHGSSRSARGVCARRRGRTWSSPRRGGSSSTARTASCGTCAEPVSAPCAGSGRGRGRRGRRPAPRAAPPPARR